jgi:Phosphotransferase enzyme family
MSRSQSVCEMLPNEDGFMRAEDLRNRVASALGASAGAIRIDRLEKRKDGSPMIYIWGASQNVSFFAKIFPASEYSVAARMETPWEVSSSVNAPRSAEAQVAIQWKRANEFKALGGAAQVPKPLGKSESAQIIVWERVDGVRIDQLVARWISRNDDERCASKALLQAGAWLRRIHDSSVRTQQSVDVDQIFDTLRAWTIRSRCSWDPDHQHALRLLYAAREAIGGNGKVLSPVTLTHGDFALPNMIWSQEHGHVVILDFEHSDYRNSWQDLATLLSSFRSKLLNPLIPKRLVQGLEEAFWAGYGTISLEAKCIIEAVALSRVFYHHLPRMETRRQRRGWLRGAVANFYLASVKNRVLERRLGISAGL